MLYGTCYKTEKGRNHSERVGGVELEASNPLGKMLCPEPNLSNRLHLINALVSFFFFFFLSVFLDISPFSSEAVAFILLEARCEMCLESPVSWKAQL